MTFSFLRLGTVWSHFWGYFHGFFLKKGKNNPNSFNWSLFFMCKNLQHEASAKKSLVCLARLGFFNFNLGDSGGFSKVIFKKPSKKWHRSVDSWIFIYKGFRPFLSYLGLCIWVFKNGHFYQRDAGCFFQKLEKVRFLPQKMGQKWPILGQKLHFFPVFWKMGNFSAWRCPPFFQKWRKNGQNLGPLPMKVLDFHRFKSFGQTQIFETPKMTRIFKNFWSLGVWDNSETLRHSGVFETPKSKKAGDFWILGQNGSFLGHF